MELEQWIQNTLSVLSIDVKFKIIPVANNNNKENKENASI